MPLKVYNSKSRSKEEFLPLHPPQVNMYVCGITAYDYCHLGHARASVIFDVIYRYLLHKGFQVNYVRNFTDIDDKILKRAQELKKDWKEIAQTFIQAFTEDMAALGNLKPNSEPKATDYMEEMKEMIDKLLKKGIAYPGNGDVFYSVRKFPTYGELAQKKIEELESGARVEISEAKQDPLDFALWKAAKPGEPAWPAPWGPGRPGWHIECSAMSTRLLGPSFDIHGGGRDLIFPHHENERAQSEGAFGKSFVKYWLHNGFVNLNADKMSKSTGNFMTIRDVLEKYPAQAVRHFLLSSHYRSPLDFNEKNMEESSGAVDRIYETLLRLNNYSTEKSGDRSTPELEKIHSELEIFEKKFEGAMDDDFNTAMALGGGFDLIREINKFLDSEPRMGSLKEVRGKVHQCFQLMGKCLGLFGEDPKNYLERRKTGALKALALSDGEIQEKIGERKEARAKKDFKLADKIRQDLANAGILLKDNPDGTTTWTIK